MDFKKLTEELQKELRYFTLVAGRPYQVKGEVIKTFSDPEYQLRFYVGLNHTHTHKIDRYVRDGRFDEGDVEEVIHALMDAHESKFSKIMIDNYGYIPRPLYLDKTELEKLRFLHLALLGYHTYSGKGEAYKVNFNDELTREAVEKYCRDMGLYYKRPTYNSVELSVAQVELIARYWELRRIDVLTYLNRLFFDVSLTPDPYPNFELPLTTLTQNVSYITTTIELVGLAAERSEKITRASLW